LIAVSVAEDFHQIAALNHDVRLRTHRRELGICVAVISSKDSDVPVNKMENRVHQYPDQGVRYILLAIEAEMLSEQAVSPYLREACLRLSRFWLVCAANGKGSDKFHAPRRACTFYETYKVEPLCT